MTWETVRLALRSMRRNALRSFLTLLGIVIGVVTLTGVGFKISYIITSWASAIAGGLSAFVPAGLASLQGMTLLAALVMTGVVCILMGAGIPTTANYIIMVTVAAPTLVQLGVEPLVAHFFVFYYGVLADITPPVALAAYAAAGMAGGDPFRTGNTAFRLGLAKALVPFVFVFSPSLLLVAKGFTLGAFAVTFIGCVLGIVALSVFALLPAWGVELFDAPARVERPHRPVQPPGAPVCCSSQPRKACRAGSVTLAGG